MTFINCVKGILCTVPPLDQCAHHHCVKGILIIIRFQLRLMESNANNDLEPTSVHSLMYTKRKAYVPFPGNSNSVSTKPKRNLSGVEKENISTKSNDRFEEVSPRNRMRHSQKLSSRFFAWKETTNSYTGQKERAVVLAYYGAALWCRL